MKEQCQTYRYCGRDLSGPALRAIAAIHPVPELSLIVGTFRLNPEYGVSLDDQPGRQGTVVQFQTAYGAKTCLSIRILAKLRASIQFNKDTRKNSHNALVFSFEFHI